MQHNFPPPPKEKPRAGEQGAGKINRLVNSENPFQSQEDIDAAVWKQLQEAVITKAQAEELYQQALSDYGLYSNFWGQS